MDGTNSEKSGKFYSEAWRNASENTKHEQCVCCHKPVNITKEEDIEFRPFYIEGAGQLCYDCYHELYPEKARDRNRP